MHYLIEINLSEINLKISKLNLHHILYSLNDSSPVSGFTHCYYNYPARFSPIFVRSIINAFSQPGDTIIDPFMGGGTTVVESLTLGRRVIGLDINPLSVFIAKVKTTPISKKRLQTILDFFKDFPSEINLRFQNTPHENWKDYQNNIPWWIRKTLELMLDKLEGFNKKEEQFSRMVLLKTAQWALESQRKPPSKECFINHAINTCEEMAYSLRSFSDKIAEVFNDNSNKIISKNRLLMNTHAQYISESILPQNWKAPKIILTSPPYWGVHILYHRWQVQGRRETPAPFWIANKLDGYGAGFYTFGARNTRKTDYNYLHNSYDVFESIKSIMDSNTIIVQLIGFANADVQLPRYLKLLKDIGLKEVKLGRNINQDYFISRNVPNRKWYTDTKLPGKEYLLIHKI